jgi:hypothetical protein
MSKLGEDYFLNPPPGSAAERAVEFGIDLTLTLENLRLTALYGSAIPAIPELEAIQERQKIEQSE